MGSGLMKGARFEFSMDSVTISGEGVVVKRPCKVSGTRRSGENTVATLEMDDSDETLIRLPSESGLDLIGLSWGNTSSKWTLKLARSEAAP